MPLQVHAGGEGIPPARFLSLPALFRWQPRTTPSQSPQLWMINAMPALLNRSLLLAIAVLVASCRPSGKSNRPEEFRAELKNAADLISRDLLRIRRQVESLAEYTATLYQPDAIVRNQPLADPSVYALSRDGVLYKPVDDGKSAVFVSGHVPVDEEIRRIVCFTEPLDVALRKIVNDSPEVVQAYYNDRNSYNRIYPFFDVLSQYEPGMDIPEYNFYYLADEKHDPARQGVWVSQPYVDPAGRGWMISAIAPVYVGGRLEGVPGLDVTLRSITDTYIDGGQGNRALLANDGTIVAISDHLAIVLSLPPLENHQYMQTIRMDTFRSDDFNLLKSRTRVVRDLAEEVLTKRKPSVPFIKDGQRYVVEAAPVEELGWVLIALQRE